MEVQKCGCNYKCTNVPHIQYQITHTQDQIIHTKKPNAHTKTRDLTNRRRTSPTFDTQTFTWDKEIRATINKVRPVCGTKLKVQKKGEMDW